ncbi:MAG TPA: DUF6232 family protein [Myxococcaceae bacterium]|jgi:hypothetical protein
MTAPELVHLDGPNVVIGSRGFPLERVSGISAEERRPRYRPWFIGLGMAVLAIPFLNAVGDRYAALSYGLVAATIFASIFRVTFGGATYVLVLEVAGEKQVALKSSDHQFIISVMADVHELLHPRSRVKPQ